MPTLQIHANFHVIFLDSFFSSPERIINLLLFSRQGVMLLYTFFFFFGFVRAETLLVGKKKKIT